MTMLLIGDSLSITQPGATFQDFGISDAAFSVGGVTGVMIASSNRTSWWRIFTHVLDVGFKHRQNGAVLGSTDNAWHTFYDCSWYKNNRVGHDFGDCIGALVVGGEMEVVDAGVGFQSGRPSGYPVLNSGKGGYHIKIFGILGDSTGDSGPLWSGFAHWFRSTARVEIGSCKWEAYSCAGYFDDPTATDAGRGLFISGNNYYGIGSQQGTGLVFGSGMIDVTVVATAFNGCYQDVADRTGTPTEVTWLATGTGNMTVHGKNARSQLRELAIGASGTKILQHLSNTASWTPGAIAANTGATTTITVTGAALGDVVALGYNQNLNAGLILTGWVSSSNTVTAQIRNVTAGSLTPTAGTVRADVWQH